MVQKVKAQKLVFDGTLYPRGDVDEQNIGYMVRSLEAGAKLPPLLVDAKSFRIVDGVHRWHAWRRFSGDDGIEIDCEVKTYPSERALFLDAVRSNAKHGSQLTTFDRTRCILRAEELKIPEDQIAAALCLTVEKVGDLRQGRVGRLTVRASSGEDEPVAMLQEGRRGLIPLKRSIDHMAGRLLNQKQAEINEHLSGMEPLYHVHQILLLLDGELIDDTDTKIMDGLKQLRLAIGIFLRTN